MGKTSKKRKKRAKKQKSALERMLKQIGVVTSLIIAMGTIVIGFFTIWDWYKENKKIVIQVQEEIDVSYISAEDNWGENLYPLFRDYIDVNKKDYVGNECATQLMVTNHYDTEIAISEIILDVEELKVDYTPYLAFTNCFGENEKCVYVEISNIGWTDVFDLKCTAVGKKQDLSNYFSQDALTFYIPKIKIGEKIKIPFLDGADLINPSQERIDFEVDFVVECKNAQQPYTGSSFLFYLQDNTLGYYPMGGGGEMVYGIKIDTEKEHFRWNENIMETIESKRMLVIPLCFFPDKSCTMKFHFILKIETDGDSYYVASPLAEVEFFIPSCGTANNDLKNYKRSESHMDVILSYPKQKATMLK